MRKTYPTDLSDAEWNYIEPHLPAPKGLGRPRTHDLREITDAVFYVLKSGCQWRMLPHDFPRDGPPSTTTSENGAWSRHLGEDQPGHPRTPQGPSQKGSPAQRWRGGFSVGQEHRGGRGRAWLRRGQEGEGQKAPRPGGHRGFRAL